MLVISNWEKKKEKKIQHRSVIFKNFEIRFFLYLVFEGNRSSEKRKKYTRDLTRKATY